MGLAKGCNGRKGVENVAHGAKSDHQQTELGTRVQTLIFSQGAGGGRERQLDVYKRQPQGLKPRFSWAFYGTTEVVP